MSALTKLTGSFAETEIDDEVVLMHLDSGEFFSLTGTAIDVWRLIDGSRGREELIAQLSSEFAAEPGQISADVDELLERLRTANLVAR